MCESPLYSTLALEKHICSRALGKEGWIWDCAYSYSCGQIIKRPFIFAFLKSQQSALNIRQIQLVWNMCKKKFAGTGLGSCISWILNLVLLKCAITCLIKSKHFQQVKRESSEVKRFRHQPCPKIVHMNPHIPGPVWSIWLGAPVMGLCIKCLLACCALTLPVTELHTLK